MAVVKTTALACAFVFAATMAYADGISSRLNIASEDGTVSAYPYKAKFTNGSVTDNGDGTVSITASGGGGGGGAAAIEAMANGVRISSPTNGFNDIGGHGVLVSGKSVGGSTATYTFNLDPSATDFIHNQSARQSGAIFSVDSATVAGPFSINTPRMQFLWLSNVSNPNGTFWAKSTSGSSPQKFELDWSYLNDGTTNLTLLMSNTNDIGAGVQEVSGWNFEDSNRALQATISDLGNIKAAGNITAFGSLNGNTLTSRPVQADASHNLYSAAISLSSGTNILGKLPSENMVSTAAFTTTINTFISSQTVTAPGGLGVTYGAIVGSMTVSNLTSGQCVQAGSGGLLTVSGSACGSGGGGGGSSTLAVTTGSVSGWSGVPISSPTAVVNFSSDTFNVALEGSATAFVTLNPSSVTLQGVVTAASLGALTGNQTITLSGDSSGTGATAITVTAAANQPNIKTLAASSTTVTGVLQTTSTYVSSAPITTDEYDNGNSSTAQTIDWTHGNMQKSTLTGNVTFTFIPPPHPMTLTLRLLTGSGGFTAAWPGTVKWSGGTAPTITTTASKSDFCICKYASDGSFYCSATGTQNF